MGGRPGPLPRPLTLFLVAAGISTHNTPWSLTFLLKAESDGDSGVGGGGVRQTSSLILFAGVAGEEVEAGGEVLRVLFRAEVTRVE